MCLFSLELSSETFLIPRRIERDINVYCFSCKVAVILLIFYVNSNFLYRFPENTEISNFMKIRSVGAETDGHRHGWTDMTKLKVAFRNFANAPKTIKTKK